MNIKKLHKKYVRVITVNIVDFMQNFNQFFVERPSNKYFNLLKISEIITGVKFLFFYEHLKFLTNFLKPDFFNGFSPTFQ